MDNSQTLELQIKSKAQEAKASVESLVKSLTNVENILTNIYLEMGSIEKKVDSSINKTTTTAAKKVNQLKQSTDKATSSADKLGNAFKKVFTFAGVKRLTTTALGWMNEAVDYTEQLNLFNVVFDNTEKNGKKMFSELGKSALQFQYKLNEAFGTNKTQTLYMQGIFESMGETVGIKDNYSAIMSETMTKLTYDLASLYNKTESATAEAIRAGVYAGQTKPLRSYGIDVTQSSLQPIVKELGITDKNGDVKSVKNMSQAEKEILRYIATLKQAKIAMGDLANTIESPSNQLKVFRQQLVETKVAFSSLFIGALSNALPYANAFLMVIKEISKAIATMFGIELKDYNAGIASQEGIYDGIADSADDASDAVKKLKRQTLGFDEIHNINENKDSGSSANGGIDQRLLDAIQGYDNGMDKVRMKATQIRDKIMEWLGFTKEIDPLTGEVSFKLGEGYTRLEKILDLLKFIGITMAGWKISKSVLGFVDNFSKSSFGKNFKKMAGLTILFTSLVYNIDAISKQLNEGPNLKNNITGITSATGLGIGTYLMTKNVKLALIVTSIDLVFQAGASINKLWDEMKPLIEENGGLWETWKDGAVIAIEGIGDGLTNLKDNIDKKIDEFGKSLLRNEKDWGTWKEEIGILWDIFTFDFKGMNDTLIENLGELKDEIDKNGGAWENWKQGVNVIWTDTKNWFKEKWNESSFGKLNKAIEENGGAWENWKQGVTRIFDDIKNFVQRLINKFKELVDMPGKLVKELSYNSATGKTGLAGAWENWKQGWNYIFGKANGGVYSNGTWKDIPQYENGGAPSHGSLVFAGENGPEILGNANGKTEILNKSQIASSIYSAVYSAMSQFSGGGVAEINVHADKGVIVETAINGIQQHVNQTGDLPFTIPAY